VALPTMSRQVACRSASQEDFVADTATRDDPRSQAERVPGGTAGRPSEIPRKGWLHIAKRGWAEAKADQVPLLAAGVAFYSFLALFPAIIAGVLIYGLVADPQTIADQVGPLVEPLPAEARTLILNQLREVAASQGGGIGWGVAATLLLALWSASGGVNNLMTAINTAYDEEDTRSFIKKRALALALTVAAIIFMVIMLFLVAVFPAAIQLINSTPLRFLLQVVRWIVLAAAITVALAVLYRVAPHRDAPKIRWVSVGAIVAAILWLLASVGFSVYVAQFGNYAKTYGALAGIVVLLFWLWITSYAVLLGAEINAESEQQTIKDTTKGPSAPLGQRGAVKADSVPDALPEQSDKKK
jgi:membrane protein